MKPIFPFYVLLLLGAFSLTNAQTLEELFSIQGLSINAYHNNFYDGTYSKAYTFLQSTTFCENAVLEYVNNQTGSRLYLKIDGEEVYSINANCVETLWYDFGLDIGDQMTDGVYAGATLVNKYQGTLLNGETRTFYDLEGVQGFGPANVTWIEGIGDINNGLLASYWDFEGGDVFACAKVGDELLWGGNLTSCDFYSCAQPIIEFAYELEGLTLDIKNESLFSTSFTWDFGDGNTSTDVDPVHEYAAPGCYVVRVTATNDCVSEAKEYDTSIAICIDETWETQTTFDDLNIFQLKRFDNGLQFAYRNDVLKKSIDDGQTWLDLSIPAPSNSGITRFIRYLEMYDENNGIISLGHYGANSSEKAILVTHDGGLTWEEKVAGSYFTRRITIGEGGTAWVLAASYEFYYYKTDDYGDTWTTISLPDGFSIHTFQYMDNGLLVGQMYEYDVPTTDFFFATSDDGGQTWNMVQSPTYIRSFTAIDELTAYGSGLDGIYKTVDGGNSWSLLYADFANYDIGNELFHIWEGDQDVMWYEDGSNLLYYTTDAWQTYTTINCDRQYLISFVPLSATKILATFENTIIEYDAENVIFCSTENAAFELNTKVLLEGAYDGNGTMKTLLTDVLPLEQPYNIAPYNYTGTEALSNIPTNMVDWVLVEMRSGTPDLVEANTEVVETKAGILQADGSITGVNGEALQFTNLTVDENYYICIRHRNHLDILSANPVIAQASMTYDFTSNMNQAFGDFQQKEMEDGKVVLHVGDYTQDGVIQISDFDAWKADPATINTYNVLDGTLDNVVQVTDFDAWILNKAKLGVIEVQY